MYICTCLSFRTFFLIILNFYAFWAKKWKMDYFINVLFKEFSNKSLERDQQRMMEMPRFQEYKMFVSRNIHLLDK